MIPPRYEHQQTIVDFCHSNPRVLNFSDPGTGKTRAHIDAYAERSGRKRALVLAPLSILQAAWGQDIQNYQPGLRYSIADAKNRKKALYDHTDVVLCNHDGIKGVFDLFKADKHVLDDFDTIIIDEATAFKNLAGRGGSSRAQAMANIRHLFPYRHLLTGTPATNSVLDLWALAFLADDGERLGNSFYAFRNQVTIPEQVGPSAQMIRWVDRPGSLDIVSKKLEDITVRFAKHECVDIPKNHVFNVYTELPRNVRNIYNEMLHDSVVSLETGAVINAIHAGARANKLLQICTGAVYNEDGLASVVHLERYETVIQLVEERAWPCVVVFNWRHERDQLIALANKRNIGFETIDGDTPSNRRADIVARFQAGQIRMLLIHPQSAAHGLTLTAGRSTIWASPTANAEHFLQANARIDRNGQQHETETILITARNTREDRVYDMLQGKVDRVGTLLDIFTTLRRAA